MSILTLRSASAPSSQLSHFFSLLPLWLPPPPSVTPTFSCSFPWQHPPREEGDIVKTSRWYKSGYVSDWQLNVLIPGLWRGVITSPLKVYITRHCYFTGYILPPPWEPDVEKVNGQLVSMQDYFLPAGVCAWEQQLKVGCRRSRVSLLLVLVFQSLCYSLCDCYSCNWKQPPTESDQLLLLTGQSSSERRKTIKGNSTFQSGYSLAGLVTSLENFAVWAKDSLLLWTCVHLQPWSVRGMWKTWCRRLGAPHICPMLHTLVKRPMHVNDRLCLSKNMQAKLW